MSLLELLLTWKIKLLKWAFYAFLIVLGIVFLLVKSLNLSFTHSYTEDALAKNAGWIVDLKDESHFGWQDGLSIKYKQAQVLSPAPMMLEGVEYSLSDLFNHIMSNDDGMTLRADAMIIDNMRLEDVALKTSMTQEYLLTAEKGDLNTGLGDPKVSKILAQALPVGRGQNDLKCLYAPFDVRDDILYVRKGFLETGPAFVGVEGRVNLLDETMDLTLNPQSKNDKDIVQPVPFRLTGALSSPQVQVNSADVMSRLGVLLGKRSTLPKADIIKCGEV